MQFHLYRNKGPSKERTPFLLDLQHDFLSDLSTRIVAPVRRRTGNPLLERLHIAVEIDGNDYVIYLTESAAVFQRYIGDIHTSLEELRDEIISGVDLIFTGF